MREDRFYSVRELLTKLEAIKSAYGRTCDCNMVGRIRDSIDFCYRGIGNAAYKLRPLALNADLCRVENEYFDAPLARFQQEASNYLRTTCGKEKLLWMQYAQHFGSPTRLLDFTTNPLVALYFACQSFKAYNPELGYEEELDGVFWVLCPYNYNTVVSSKHAEADTLNSGMDEDYCQMLLESAPGEQFYPMFFTPEYIDQRMNAQCSRFMLWPNARFDLEDLSRPDNWMDFSPATDGCSAHRYARRLIVPKDAKRAILRELDLLGVNEKTLFPGLDSIGNYVKFLFLPDLP